MAAFLSSTSKNSRHQSAAPHRPPSACLIAFKAFVLGAMTVELVFCPPETNARSVVPSSALIKKGFNKQKGHLLYTVERIRLFLVNHVLRMGIQVVLHSRRGFHGHMRKRLPFKQITAHVGTFQPKQLRFTLIKHHDFTSLPFLIQLLHSILNQFKWHISILLGCSLILSNDDHSYKNGSFRYKRRVKRFDVGDVEEATHQFMCLVHL